MPRRPQKTQEELRELILEAARSIIEERGTETLSAREIARAIKYSPGTLYNVFKNIDDIKWHVEIRLLRELAQFLADEVQSTDNGDLENTVNRFFEFSAAHSNIWPLIADEIVSRKSVQPDEHKALIASIETTIAETLREHLTNGLSEATQAEIKPSRKKQAPKTNGVSSDTRGEDAFIVLYALSSLDATRRLPTLTNRSARDIANDYLKRLIA